MKLCHEILETQGYHIVRTKSLYLCHQGQRFCMDRQSHYVGSAVRRLDDALRAEWRVLSLFMSVRHLTGSSDNVGWLATSGRPSSTE